MTVWEIWSEGYIITGGRGYATFHADSHGETFKEACENYAKRNPEFAEYFSAERMTYWGCRLYDNHNDAAKEFG